MDDARVVMEGQIPPMGSFRDLVVWREAVALAGATYRLTHGLPSAERYGLSSQLRRAAVSVSANIAEGCGRGGDRELVRFLQIARGSAHEVESLLAVTVELGMLDGRSIGAVQVQADRVSRQLTRLIRRLTPA